MRWLFDLDMCFWGSAPLLERWRTLEVAAHNNERWRALLLQNLGFDICIDVGEVAALIPHLAAQLLPPGARSSLGTPPTCV